MSDADPEAVTVSADGFTVRKTVDTEQFQTLAVVLELASVRDEAARLQLVDPIPADVSMDDVGFHPEYGSEFWSVEDGAVVFEREFEPEEAYTTIYGIRDYPTDEAETLLVDPEIGLADSMPDSLDDIVDEERSEVVREFLTGEADLPGLEAEVAADAAASGPASAEAVEPGGSAGEPAAAQPDPAGGEPAAEVATQADSGAGSAPDPTAETGAEDRGDVRVPLTGGVVRVLIKELREGDVDPEDRRMLRDELVDTEGSQEVRLNHLQQRVSDLEAYADALEAFIDEEGTAEAIISDLQDDVAGLERSVRETDDRLDEVLEELGSVGDRLETVADEVAAVESQGDLLDGRVEDLEAEVVAVDQRADDLGARVDEVSVDVDAVDDRTGDLDARIDELRDELAETRHDLQSGLESVEADLEGFEAFRERLSSVFGASESVDESTGD